MSVVLSVGPWRIDLRYDRERLDAGGAGIMTEAAIFMAALDKPTEAERAVFVADACAGDERLRRRVLALLRAHDEPDDLLDPTTDGPDATGAMRPS
jgi:hypothetical protein